MLGGHGWTLCMGFSSSSLHSFSQGELSSSLSPSSCTSVPELCGTAWRSARGSLHFSSSPAPRYRGSLGRHGLRQGFSCLFSSLHALAISAESTSSSLLRHALRQWLSCLLLLLFASVKWLSFVHGYLHVCLQCISWPLASLV